MSVRIGYDVEGDRLLKLTHLSRMKGLSIDDAARDLFERALDMIRLPHEPPAEGKFNSLGEAAEIDWTGEDIESLQALRRFQAETFTVGE